LSLLALQHLALDEVWWLVSPQNPLKPVAGMAAFAVRLERARRVGVTGVISKNLPMLSRLVAQRSRRAAAICPAG